MVSSFFRASKSKKSKSKINLIQPSLTLDVQLTKKASSSMYSLKEFSLVTPRHRIQMDMVRLSIALFISEVVLKALPEEQADESIFQFVEGFYTELELDQENLSLFPLLFLIKFSHYLGFYPNIASTQQGVFDLMESEFKPLYTKGPHILGEQESNLLKALLGTKIAVNEPISWDQNVRKNLLESMVKYYGIHLEGFKEIKSLEVLQEVFNG